MAGPVPQGARVNALLLFLLVSGASVPATAETLRREVLEVTRRLEIEQAEVGHVAENLRRLAVDKAAAEKNLSRLRLQQADLELHLRTLEVREQGLAEEWDGLLVQAARRMRLLSRRAGAGSAEVLLSSEGPSDFVYRYHALRFISTADRALLEELQTRQDLMAAARAEMERRKAEVERLQADAQAEVRRLAALEQLRRTQAARLHERVGERRAWIESMRDSAAAMGVLLESMATGAAARPLDSVREPVAGLRTVNFGDPDPVAGAVLTSRGWRYQAPAGTAVYAVAPGTVTYADWFQGYGFLVLVDHGGGVVTLYAHLDRIDTAVGEAVDGATLLGTAGTSGSVFEPGMYFEVRRQGKPIDPGAWLRAVAARLLP